MQCVILAGGRGTRMALFTARIPKSLIPVLGKPFIDHQLQHLAKTGVTDIVLCIGYKGDQIKAYVKDGEAWKLRVRYVEEGDALRGTAGALRLALDQQVLQPAFLLTFGDSYLPIDFSEVWRYFETRSEPILMTVYKNEHKWGASNVKFDGKKVILYDKDAGEQKDPAFKYLDYGLLGLRRSIVEMDTPERGAYDLAPIMKQRSLRQDIAGMEVKTRFYEVGSSQGLKDLSNYLSQGAH